MILYWQKKRTYIYRGNWGEGIVRSVQYVLQNSCKKIIFFESMDFRRQFQSFKHQSIFQLNRLQFELMKTHLVVRSLDRSCHLQHIVANRHRASCTVCTAWVSHSKAIPYWPMRLCSNTYNKDAPLCGPYK